MDRRSFLASGGKVALAASLPLLTRPFPMAPQERSALADENTALLAELGPPAVEMLLLATRAPSGHNTQPWTVRVLDKQQWIIGIDQSRRLPGVDPTARETLLSLGAFLENLVIAATHYGYAVDYDVIARTPSDAEIIDLRLRTTSAVSQALAQIRLRRTVRNGYLSGEIKATDIASVVGKNNGQSNVESNAQSNDFHYFPSSSATAKYLAEGTVEANRQQAFRDPAEEELANWIRWSADDAAKYRNGLTPAGMEIDGLAGWYVSHFYDRANVLSKSFRETTIKQVVERVSQGGGWMVVSSTGSSVATLIETGRQFERMWLRLRDKNIAIHPMTQMLEESPWREQVAKNLGIDSAQFLLRIGYVGSYPNPASLRMPPGWITKVTKSAAPGKNS